MPEQDHTDQTRDSNSNTIHIYMTAEQMTNQIALIASISAGYSDQELQARAQATATAGHSSAARLILDVITYRNR